MKLTYHNRFSGLCILIIFLMRTAQTSAQECGEYEVTMIAGFQCGDHLASVVPQAISETGDVVGYTSCNFFVQAFHWTAKDGLQSIPMPDGTFESKALAISGTKIVGTYDNPDLELGKTGFLYDYATNEFSSLHTLPGGNWSEAHAINSIGEVVGFWGDTVQGPSPLAFIWRDGEMIDINPDFGTLKSEANGINANGAVTGWMGSSSITDARAFIWDEGTATELPLLPNAVTSNGNSINSIGNVKIGEGG